MFLKKYKPTTPGVRHKNIISNFGFNIPKLKIFTVFLKNKSGRNNTGSLVLRTRSYVRRNKYCIIDSCRKNLKLVSLVCSIFKQKKNSSFLSLIKYSNGAMSYIKCSHGTKLGQYLYYITFPLNTWDCYYPSCIVLMRFLPSDAIFSNVCLNHDKLSKYVKSAGNYARIFQFFDELDCISFKLPAGYIRYLSFDSYVVLGRNSNIYYNRQVFGKSGFLRNFGWKPKVRGVAMNPVDHPHGGRTKTSKPELSPWGWVAKFNK